MQEALPAIAQQNNKHGSSIFDVGKRGHLQNVENNRIFEANNSALRRKCEDMTDSCWAGRATASLCICGSLRTLCKHVCVAVCLGLVIPEARTKISTHVSSNNNRCHALKHAYRASTSTSNTGH